MNAIVLDPKVLLHPDCSDASTSSHDGYLNSLEDWLTTGRKIVLGPAGRDLIVDEFSKFGYPGQALNLPQRATTREVLSRITKLLIGAYGSAEYPKSELVSPEYLAQESTRIAAESDVSFAASVESAAFGSAEAHWRPAASKAFLADGGSVDLVYNPNVPTPADLENSRSAFYASRTIVCIGGLRDDTALRELRSLGVLPKELKWVELEKLVSAAIVGKRLAGVQGSGYVVACLTGHVGHDGSGKAKDIASRRGAIFVRGEHVKDIVQALTDLPFAESGRIG